MVRAMVVSQPNLFEEMVFPKPEIKDEDMLLKVEMVSVCGSDPKMFMGKHPLVTLPVILGHEVVGYVDEIGFKAAEIYGVSVGDRIIVEPYIMCRNCEFCLTGNYQLCAKKRSYGFTISCNERPHLWGAYSEYLYISPGSKIHKISTDVIPEAACLATVIGNGVRWIKTKGKAQFGQTVVIIGPGAQGLASVIVAKEAGLSKIIVLGTKDDEIRMDLAREYGATHTITVDNDNSLEAVRQISNGKMADLVVECTGNPNAIGEGINYVKPLGRYVIAGVTGGKQASFITDTIVNKEITILGGHGQSWNVEQAVEIINSKKYRIDKMITHKYSIFNANEAMNFFISKDKSCVRVAMVP